MISTDDHPIIRAKEAEIAAKRRELDLLEAELRGMKSLVAQIPSGFRATRMITPVVPIRATSTGESVAPSSKSNQPHKGRQPGAISFRWRRILSALRWDYAHHGFTPEELAKISFTFGLKMRPSEAHAQLIHYRKFNYVEPHLNGGYFVTDYAAQKFGFDKEPLKDEAPNAETREPQESLGPGDQTGAV